jgi:hypothetical protein
LAVDNFVNKELETSLPGLTGQGEPEAGRGWHRENYHGIKYLARHPEHCTFPQAIFLLF